MSSFPSSSPSPFAFINLYLQCHICRHVEAVIASLGDLTFDPPSGNHSVAVGMQYGAMPVLETWQIQGLSKSGTSTLHPLLLLADRQPRVLDFIFSFAVFFIFLPLFLWLWMHYIQRGTLGTQALCKKSWSLKHTDQSWWCHQCRLRGSSGACFIFRCQGNTRTHKDKHTMIELVKNHASLSHSSISFIDTKNRSTSPHCYLCFIRFFVGVFALPFCFCLPLDTHRGAKPKCSSYVSSMSTITLTHNHRETWSALTSRSLPICPMSDTSAPPQPVSPVVV